MEEDQEKRMEFINTNIMEAGIDLEEITKFAEDQGKTFDSLNVDELKTLVEQFNNKDKQSQEKKEEPKKEETKVVEEKKEEPKKEEINQEPKKEEKKAVGEKNQEPKKEEKKVVEEKKEEPKKEEKKEPEKSIEKKDSGKKSEKKSSKDQNKPAEEEIPKNLPKLKLYKELYHPETFEYKTIIQQNNKLLELVKEKKPIQVKISSPKREAEKTLFSKAIFSYRVECPELGSDVRRTYADFEWLCNELNKRYPLRLCPVIVKENIVKQMGKNLKSENDDNFELRKIRYLEQFIETILNKKILVSSPIFYEFLVLDKLKLIKYKTILENKPYKLEVSMSNLITVKGEAKGVLEENTIKDAEMLSVKAYALADIYNKIVANLDMMIIDYNNLTQHLKNISIFFNLLNQCLTTYKYTNADDLKETFNDLKASFENWSTNMNKQCEFFSQTIKEKLNYMSSELTEVTSYYKQYRDFKSEYEDFTEMIKREKEQLISSYISAELRKESNKGKTAADIKYNEKVFDEVFYKKDLLMIGEKKRLCTAMNYMMKDYNKLIKLHSKKLKVMNEATKKAIIINFIQG